MFSFLHCCIYKPPFLSKGGRCGCLFIRNNHNKLFGPKDSKLPENCSPGAPPSPPPYNYIFGLRYPEPLQAGSSPLPTPLKLSMFAWLGGREALLRLGFWRPACLPNRSPVEDLEVRRKACDDLRSAPTSATGRGASTLPPKLFRGRSGQKRRNISSPELEVGAEARNGQAYWRAGDKEVEPHSAEPARRSSTPGTREAVLAHGGLG